MLRKRVVDNCTVNPETFLWRAVVVQADKKCLFITVFRFPSIGCSGDQQMIAIVTDGIRNRGAVSGFNFFGVMALVSKCDVGLQSRVVFGKKQRKIKVIDRRVESS